MADTIRVEAKVNLPGLACGRTGDLPRSVAEMALARGYAVRVDSLSSRRPNIVTTVSTSMDESGPVGA